MEEGSDRDATSPQLFNKYDEAMMREALEDLEKGIKVGGVIIKSIRFADDKAIVARSNTELQELMNAISRVTQAYGMKINVKKTKTMCISRHGVQQCNVVIDGQQVEQVNQFKYLGSLMTEDGR